MEERIVKLEELAAHLTRVTDELSEVIARQESEITNLNRRIEMLMQRAAEQEMDVGGTVPVADQKPPHW